MGGRYSFQTGPQSLRGRERAKVHKRKGDIVLSDAAWTRESLNVRGEGKRGDERANKTNGGAWKGNVKKGKTKGVGMLCTGGGERRGRGGRTKTTPIREKAKKVPSFTSSINSGSRAGGGTNQKFCLYSGRLGEQWSKKKNQEKQ